MSEALQKWVFRLSAVIILLGAGFGYGYGVGALRWPPADTLKEMTAAAKSLVKFGEIMPEKLLLEPPAHAARERVRIHRPEAMVPGYYAFVGWDDEQGNYAVWLYDHLGERVHVWPMSDEALYFGTQKGANEPHGFIPLADGSVVVNFALDNMLTRIDACGAAEWTREGASHHLIQQAEDGTLWTWRGDGSGIAHYQYLENIDPEDGTVLKSIGLIEDVIADMAGESAIFWVRPDYEFKRLKKYSYREDIFHPNDVDVLTSELAPHFPAFEAGDLLISLRTPNLIAVLDPDTAAVKWSSNGPWKDQHDPDFTDDGTISVYNNNKSRGRSEIIRMDPDTREVRNDLFGGEVRFYSSAMGQHQYLPEGNVLIVAPGEGRVLVTTAEGERVLEFNNLSAGEARFNGRVENAAWLPEDFFDQVPACSK